MEIGDGPIRANINLVMPDGQPYAAGKKRAAAPLRVGVSIPIETDSPTRAGAPAPGGGVKVLFEVGAHTITSTFAEVSTSAGGGYLVFDVTDRPDAFLPFFAHLKAHRPHGEVISALPAGGDRAFSLAVDQHPPVAIAVAGRKVYLVPVVQTADVPQTEQVRFALQAEAAPAFEELTDGHDQDRGDRGAHPARPDLPEGFVPFGSDDPGTELRLHGDEGGGDGTGGHTPLARSSVLT